VCDVLKDERVASVRSATDHTSFVCVDEALAFIGDKECAVCQTMDPAQPAACMLLIKRKRNEILGLNYDNDTIQVLTNHEALRQALVSLMKNNASRLVFTYISRR
jgi:hypothetical protein